MMRYSKNYEKGLKTKKKSEHNSQINSDGQDTNERENDENYNQIRQIGR